MKNRWTFFLILSLLCTVFACRDHKPIDVVQTQQSQSVTEEDPLIKTNAKIVQLEDEEITLFIQRYGWEMQKTESGLRYQITHATGGKIPKPGDEVVLKYVMKLLSGETVYTSTEDGLMTFKVEKSEAIPGLHEAVQLMRMGETARLVLPSHLAYGASGDGRMIGRYTPLAIIMEITEVK
ncbi:MAG: FKBP-type peptidyl-prolyl cis-trans isomerase [Bacteroidales bacterium]|jgi:FKBP-type peptidyl-prolyl cis-trans isomerase|nr:FKBP-type peptidyl-prolyl cis-trans isomerase [Bacteroidales bacterium]